ncbi:MAG: hypothetical protein SNJ79_03165 [Sphingomonadaceae bacterium]
MPSEFPLRPRIRKGGLAAYRLPSPIPTVIIFQYNPDEVSRSLRQPGGARGRGDAQRTSGPPEETISFTVSIDAADQLAEPAAHAATVAMGLHPVVAALESLLLPAFPLVVANEALALGGSGFIAAEDAPLVLLVWGRHRVVPVRVESLSIREQAFDVNLNPIRLEADLSLKVLTYRDLSVTSPGYWVYMASFAQKEGLTAANSFASVSAIADLLPV